MKQMLWAMLAVTMLAAGGGCCCMDRCGAHPWGCGLWGCCKQDACGGGCGQSGCDTCGQGQETACPSCGHGILGHGGCKHCGHGLSTRIDANEPTGPNAQNGTVAYPYYTTRGPRDFLANNPRGIGP